MENFVNSNKFTIKYEMRSQTTNKNMKHCLHLNILLNFSINLYNKFLSNGKLRLNQTTKNIYQFL
jgi:hypothetical protein